MWQPGGGRIAENPRRRNELAWLARWTYDQGLRLLRLDAEGDEMLVCQRSREVASGLCRREAFGASNAGQSQLIANEDA